MLSQIRNANWRHFVVGMCIGCVCWWLLPLQSAVDAAGPAEREEVVAVNGEEGPSSDTLGPTMTTRDLEAFTAWYMSFRTAQHEALCGEAFDPETDWAYAVDGDLLNLPGAILLGQSASGRQLDFEVLASSSVELDPADIPADLVDPRLDVVVVKTTGRRSQVNGLSVALVMSCAEQGEPAPRGVFRPGYIFPIRPVDRTFRPGPDLVSQAATPMTDAEIDAMDGLWVTRRCWCEDVRCPSGENLSAEACAWYHGFCNTLHENLDICQSGPAQELADCLADLLWGGLGVHLFLCWITPFSLAACAITAGILIAVAIMEAVRCNGLAGQVAECRSAFDQKMNELETRACMNILGPFDTQLP